MLQCTPTGLSWMLFCLLRQTSPPVSRSAGLLDDIVWWLQHCIIHLPLSLFMLVMYCCGNHSPLFLMHDSCWVQVDKMSLPIVLLQGAAGLPLGGSTGHLLFCGFPVAPGVLTWPGPSVTDAMSYSLSLAPMALVLDRKLCSQSVTSVL